ncbi:MAG TPA: sigma 54-interacting transcriptional regulator, partial [Desulfobaccales bacterium]|nr:sigma 54-interacting transcriptional regulator [Desulfobaccales bacterium]
ATVVLEGESGTGKDLFAQVIHLRSPRATGPFVAFSCSALVETLIESELFGHVKGAFTGAISHKVGRFEMAKGGTLFLDEIGELKLELQVKLLRVLESKVFERVGSSQPIPMEARIIAATSRNLKEEVRTGRFRMDLLYRLRTVPFYLPPLRERQEDIPRLANHCLERLNRKYHKEVRGVDPKVMSLFQNYAWPGNIRELERVLEYAFVFWGGDHQRPAARTGIPPPPAEADGPPAPAALGQRALNHSEGPAPGPGQPGGRGPGAGHQPQFPVAQDEGLRPAVNLPRPASKSFPQGASYAPLVYGSSGHGGPPHRLFIVSGELTAHEQLLRKIQGWVDKEKCRVRPSKHGGQCPPYPTAPISAPFLCFIHVSPKYKLALLIR